MALRRKVIPLPRPPRVYTKTLPAPVGGLNRRDSLESMPIEDAVSMDNMWPSTTDVVLRFGRSTFATKDGQHETLMAYNSGSTSKLFSIAGGSIYNISSGGAIGAADVTGLTNSRMQYANMTTSGGSYLFGVNGDDKQRIYDGTNWHTDGDGAPYDITNVDSATLIQPNVFKSRLWYVQEGTLKSWYLPISSIGGAATALDLSAVFQLGGSLTAMGTWTLDAGYGVDDYAVWITSQGEIAVYRLTDPTTPTGIALVGIWRTGTPIGRRCMIKYENDLLIITQTGVVSMTVIFTSTSRSPGKAVTDKISSLISQYVSLYGGNFGWQLIQYPKENQLYLNVPVQQGNNQQQLVMNTISRNWGGPFTNWNANCWEVFNDDLYYGSNGFIGKAWDTLADDGDAITGNTLQAFSPFGNMNKKRFTGMRPYLQVSGQPMVYVNMNVDFDTTDQTAAASTVTIPYALWDSATWDSGIWGADLVLSANWQGANTEGFYGAPRVKVESTGVQVRWASTTVNYEVAQGVMI
jgi:hypothetical protein